MAANRSSARSRVRADGSRGYGSTTGELIRLGNFWVGSMRNNVDADGELGEAGPGEGVLFRVAPEGAVTRWRDNLGISNTLCWGPDRDRFYFADTLENEVYVYDFNADGSIRNERKFLRRASLVAA